MFGRKPAGRRHLQQRIGRLELALLTDVGQHLLGAERLGGRRIAGSLQLLPLAGEDALDLAATLVDAAGALMGRLVGERVLPGGLVDGGVGRRGWLAERRAGQDVGEPLVEEQAELAGGEDGGKACVKCVCGVGGLDDA